jgi:hypothetical protein
MSTKAGGGVGIERAIDRTAGGDPVSTAVIEAIADIESVEPKDLDLRLYDAIDPEALERLCDDAESDLVLEFSVADYRVRVTGEGTVFVRPS